MLLAKRLVKLKGGTSCSFPTVYNHHDERGHFSLFPISGLFPHSVFDIPHIYNTNTLSSHMQLFK